MVCPRSVSRRTMCQTGKFNRPKRVTRNERKSRRELYNLLLQSFRHDPRKLDLIVANKMWLRAHIGCTVSMEELDARGLSFLWGRFIILSRGIATN